ncbi:MAG: hypothetical protein WDM77_21715 [Steroidobacteraceae bacterium]
MPTQYARSLIETQRSAAANQQLGALLAFLAGAINAGVTWPYTNTPPT